MNVDELEEQPIPADTRCPECGGEPLPDRVTHNLSAIGYTHDDIQNVCADCGGEWTCGVPIGEFDRPEMEDDLWCDACDDSWVLIHRVAPKSTYIVLHTKCPNPDCNDFDRIRRKPDDSGVALVGYPQITGSTEGCKPYGWVDDGEDERANEDCPEPLCIEHGTGTLGCPLED